MIEENLRKYIEDQIKHYNELIDSSIEEEFQGVDAEEKREFYIELCPRLDRYAARINAYKDILGFLDGQYSS